MSKAVSYYDWELQFRRKTRSSVTETKRITKENIVNSLGISDNNYKDFMKKWKEKNL